MGKWNEVKKMTMNIGVQPGVPGVTDKLNTNVYDSFSDGSGIAANTTHSLFLTPRGATKSYLDTNLEQASRIPWPWMEVCGIGVKVYNRTAVPSTMADVNQMIQNNLVVFSISEKVYYRLPAHYLPAGNGLFGVTSSGSVYTNGYPMLRNLFVIDPIVVTNQVNIACDVITLSVIAAESALTYFEFFLAGNIQRSAL